MSPLFSRAMKCLAALLIPFSATGCRSPSVATDASGNRIADLKFTSHSFSAFCFETTNCRVVYHNSSFVDGSDKLEEPMPVEFLSHMTASYLGIPNFPKPAVVTWRSKDDHWHEAKIDLAEIFKDRRILHNVLENDFPKGAVPNTPGIILVVNDRTIRIYMRASVPTRNPQIPGNRYSYARDDLMLAFDRTY